MIDFYTAATPNGHKVSILLEEVGLDYNLLNIDLGAGEQRSKEFLKLNPNGRIPVIIDRANDDFAVFESGAILIYLAEKAGRFMPTEAKQRSIALQWLMFQMGGIGPMMGQAFVFLNYFPEKIPPVVSRYCNESKRLLKVLDGRLAQSEYLAGDYSIADMASWPWARLYEKIDIEIDGLNNLQRWLELVGKRDAVKRGMERPPFLPDDERIATARKIVEL